jgi:hypothetical protein
VIHYPSCRKSDEREHRLSLATGEVSITTHCRTCGISHTRVVDRADLDDEPEPPRRGWPFLGR